ncbi:uncharacterized protein MELLADRAFT_104099 [Melampsora larici-populina 98AG31]|uniref:Uncharacterized protein n=1 Tax=Melampsora larici-populina (strain 98AG31 / pathotype 3-4-7) TaxID=747676 RepID=F4RDJ8_MELLP|nr:uncharacterized protein MELLADRAFT_104099 [Melampsora larici-populina 98AG31]EGG09415.1 hypothetical protein MELLADRAFT_104099 [Melampsora larici-populina 98AG31]
MYHTSIVALNIDGGACGTLHLMMLNGVLRTGKLRNQQNGALHEAKLRRLRLKQGSENRSTPLQTGEVDTAGYLPTHTPAANCSRRRSLSTGDLRSNNLQSSSRGRTQEPGLQRRRSSSQTSRTSKVASSETSNSEIHQQTSSNLEDLRDSDAMDVDDFSENNYSIAMDWSRGTEGDDSASLNSFQSSSNVEQTKHTWPLESVSEEGSPHARSTRNFQKQPLVEEVQTKRGRPRRSQSQNNNTKRAKIYETSTSLGNTDPLPTSEETDAQASNQLMSPGISDHISPRESSEEPNLQRPNLRRSNRIRSQSLSTRVSSEVVGSPAKLQRKRSADDIDKTMMETFTRRGLFKAVLKGCPTFLRRVDAKIREELIQKLAEAPTTKWTAETNLDRDTYLIWLSYLNSESNHRYGTFSDDSSVLGGNPILTRAVQTTKILKIEGKNYTSNRVTRGCGNSAIEYHLKGKRHFGYIQYAFRAKLVPTVFLVVDQFTKLDASDSTRDCFSAHPRLQAATVYSKIECSVVVDIRNVSGHIIVLPNSPGLLGIAQETLGIVGLRNISSFNADTTSE